MPVLREAVESLGHADVVTYIQSGNVAFSATGWVADHSAVASALESAIARRTGVRAVAVVLGSGDLERIVADNPYGDPPDHRLLHAVLLPAPPGEEGAASVAAAVERARAKGSPDDACVRGRALYLLTPGGFAESVLRRELDRGGANRTPFAEGTARNWATILALRDLVQG